MKMHLKRQLAFNLAEYLPGLRISRFEKWLLVVACAVPVGINAADARAQDPSKTLNHGSNDAFIVFGKVTDDTGTPLSGVEILAHCGHGSLFLTGRTTTDTAGEYRLSFGPGVRMGAGPGVGQLGVGFQAATISARKTGYFTDGLGRTGNLAMRDSTNDPPTWSTNFAGVVQAYAPYRLDFRLQPASLIKGRLADPLHELPVQLTLCLKGDKLPPSSNVLACADLAEDGEFQFADVPVGYSWWFEITWREGETWKALRSQPLPVSAAGVKPVNLTAANDMLEIQQ
jgi:hypothetical protein